MSSAIIYNTIMLNLYKILDMQKNVEEDTIENAFNKLMLHFHPSKNNKSNNEIYFHIITANQIFCNKDNKKIYDEALNEVENTYLDLKNNFNQNINNLIIKFDSKKNFEEKMKELDIIHTIYNENYNENINKKYNKLIDERNNFFIIPKEKINCLVDFNNEFKNKKIKKLFYNEILSFAEEKILTSYNTNENYTKLALAFNLYVENEPISTSKFTNIEYGFKLINSNIVIK